MEDPVVSRGLGHLQRAILATLDDAKREQTVYTGRPAYLDDYGEWDCVCYHGRYLKLPPDVYDMRASLNYLARATGHVQTGLSLRRSTIVLPEYAQSFCRAVRRLVAAGYLERWSSPVHRGPYRDPWPNRRLIRKTQLCMTLIPNEIQAIQAKMAAKYDTYARRVNGESRRRQEAFLVAHGFGHLVEARGAGGGSPAAAGEGGGGTAKIDAGEAG